MIVDEGAVRKQSRSMGQIGKLAERQPAPNYQVAAKASNSQE